MDGQQKGPRQCDGSDAASFEIDFVARLSRLPASRLTATLGPLVAALQELLHDLALTPAEFRVALDYLTEVGHHADARRQEWVLLADALGFSALVEDLNTLRPAGATPNTVAGPFYRADAPDRPNGAAISLNGKGVPLLVAGRVLSLGGEPLAHAMVEVWQADGSGKYENQQPDDQPENNLRGRFHTDAQGQFGFTSVMPGGYSLPADGPVGRLMRNLGLCLQRPAHIHFRISAPGHERLTTQIFDQADPAIGRDAVFGVKPGLLAEFRRAAFVGGAETRALDLDLVLCPLRQG